MRPTASSREPILHHHLGQSQLATLGHGGFRCLADGDHEADHVFATCPGAALRGAGQSQSSEHCHEERPFRGGHR